jgi:hypothetical protein
MKWHKGETCREYDYRTNANIKAEEEEASKKLLAATTKQCPGCKRPIEKNMGLENETNIYLNRRYEMPSSFLLGVFATVSFRCFSTGKGCGWRKVL